MSHLKQNLFSVIKCDYLESFLKRLSTLGLAKGQGVGSMTLPIAILRITTLGVTIENVTLNIMTLDFESCLC